MSRQAFIHRTLGEGLVFRFGEFTCKKTSLLAVVKVYEDFTTFSAGYGHL